MHVNVVLEGQDIHKRVKGGKKKLICWLQTKITHWLVLKEENEDVRRSARGPKERETEAQGGT